MPRVVTPAGQKRHDDRPDDGLADDGDEGTLVVGIDVVVECRDGDGAIDGRFGPHPDALVDDPHAQVDGRVGVAGRMRGESLRGRAAAWV